MKAYIDEKIRNAIIYFSLKHNERTEKPLYQTYLYKYLAFSDFRSIEKIGEPVFFLQYRAMERGPVPIDLYPFKEKYKGKIYLKDYFDVIEDDYGIIINTKLKVNYDYFTKFEIKLFHEIIIELAHEFATTTEYSDKSHEQINSWKKAYNNKPNSMMSYFDELGEDVTNFENKINHLDFILEN